MAFRARTAGQPALAHQKPLLKVDIDAIPRAPKFIQSIIGTQLASRKSADFLSKPFSCHVSGHLFHPFIININISHLKVTNFLIVLRAPWHARLLSTLMPAEYHPGAASYVCAEDKYLAQGLSVRDPWTGSAAGVSKQE
ncbi:predicted protein [Coccidioides posadasii str. Silveira]|uniref:Predicted protein n=1 Tax=Coccidioides posadasii (strain RMSCC 757 / Silveira) TaxID=443226 RepID=E9DBA4_COCPS|nr:predicted protein [Coccidioides posadasii str. Silveira]